MRHEFYTDDYYLYGLAIKEPVGFIVLALMADRMTARRRDFWRDEGVLLAPAVLVLVSSQTGFNHHLRYVLPAFPFAFIWIGKPWGRADVGLPDEHPPRGYQPGDYSQRAGGVADRDAFGPRPGLWAVFVRPLHDQYPNFHYFQFFEPIEVLGYTVTIYQLDEEDVRRYWEAQEDAG